VQRTKVVRQGDYYYVYMVVVLGRVFSSVPFEEEFERREDSGG